MILEVPYQLGLEHRELTCKKEQSVVKGRKCTRYRVVKVRSDLTLTLRSVSLIFMRQTGSEDI